MTREGDEDDAGPGRSVPTVTNRSDDIFDHTSDGLACQIACPTTDHRRPDHNDDDVQSDRCYLRFYDIRGGAWLSVFLLANAV